MATLLLSISNFSIYIGNLLSVKLEQIFNGTNVILNLNGGTSLLIFYIVVYLLDLHHWNIIYMGQVCVYTLCSKKANWHYNLTDFYYVPISAVTPRRHFRQITNNSIYYISFRCVARCNFNGVFLDPNCCFGSGD